MKSSKVLNFLGCTFLLVTIIGCTSPISRTLRQEAASGVTFPMVFQNPDAYQGDTVIWGGSIIRTVNTKEGSRICILETSLNMRDRPKAVETSEGYRSNNCISGISIDRPRPHIGVHIGGGMIPFGISPPTGDSRVRKREAGDLKVGASKVMKRKAEKRAEVMKEAMVVGKAAMPAQSMARRSRSAFCPNKRKSWEYRLFRKYAVRNLAPIGRHPSLSFSLSGTA
ncbi:MAG: Slp family lipoprotein [Deltaproteobacteria bacterium]